MNPPTSPAPAESAEPSAASAARRADRRRIRRRYRADRRFKWYGIAALALALGFLAYFLYDIVSRGYTAFIRHEIKATLVVDRDTVEDRRRMVEGVTADLVSNAVLQERQLAALRYEFRLPVMVSPAVADEPDAAVRRGVRAAARGMVESLREDADRARARGDRRRAERYASRIEPIETAAAEIIDAAPVLLNLDALSAELARRVENGDTPEPAQSGGASGGTSGGASGGGGGGADDAVAGDTRVRWMWVELSPPANRHLLGAANNLSAENREALDELFLRHLRRLTRDYYRKVFNEEAQTRGEAWLVAASEVDLYLKGKGNRMTNSARGYERDVRLLGIEPSAEPDPFAVMAAAFERQRAQSERYVELMGELGVEPSTAPGLAAVLTARAQRMGDERGLDAFRAVIGEGGEALEDAVASLGLPRLHAESPMQLCAAMLEETMGVDAPTADELLLMATNWTHWHDATPRLRDVSASAARLREVASSFFPPRPSEDGEAYARLLSWVGTEPSGDPAPFVVLAGSLRSLAPGGYNAENLASTAGRWVLQREVRALEEAGRTRSTFNTALFTNTNSRAPEVAGLWNAIVGSVFLLAIVLAVAFPIGVLTAIYLEEFAPDNWFTRIIEVNINNLAAVPSILFGLLGLAVFINLTGWQRSAALAGGLTLSLMSLPVIIIATRAALAAVPDSIRKGAQAMGATRWQAVLHHVLPLALPGILTGTIIALAQAIGETAPLIIVGMVGFILAVPSQPLDPTTALPAQIFTWFGDSQAGFGEKAAAGIIILLLVLMFMNAMAVFLRAKFEKKW